MMSLDEWAFERAARVIEDVERHGVAIPVVKPTEGCSRASGS
jgi:hypothetical protein